MKRFTHEMFFLELSVQHQEKFKCGSSKDADAFTFFQRGKWIPLTSKSLAITRVELIIIQYFRGP